LPGNSQTKAEKTKMIATLEETPSLQRASYGSVVASLEALARTMEKSAPCGM
jgi:hypothetical protein